MSVALDIHNCLVMGDLSFVTCTVLSKVVKRKQVRSKGGTLAGHDGKYSHVKLL